VSRRRSLPPNPGVESNATDGERRKLFDTRTALDNIRVDLARVAVLAHAAYNVVAGPRPLSPADHREHHRRLDAFAYSAFDAARTALREADDAIDDLDRSDE
jgi:hypothetical protein